MIRFVQCRMSTNIRSFADMNHSAAKNEHPESFDVHRQIVLNCLLMQLRGIVLYRAVPMMATMTVMISGFVN